MQSTTRSKIYKAGMVTLFKKIRHSRQNSPSPTIFKKRYSIYRKNRKLNSKIIKNESDPLPPEKEKYQPLNPKTAKLRPEKNPKISLKKSRLLHNPPPFSNIPWKRNKNWGEQIQQTIGVKIKKRSTTEKWLKPYSKKEKKKMRVNSSVLNGLFKSSRKLESTGINPRVNHPIELKRQSVRK